ncbi:hypothetical protein ACFQ1L_15955 [Phytohabitans flavus]|uniref:hypothetical protein n=1 Tax=Phytohabitans flavus TaxID=1076124 RepID=UPI00363B64AF
MTDYVAIVKEYNTFIESTMLDEPAFHAGLSTYVTNQSVLAEPDSIFGRLEGFEGWSQWRTAAADMAGRSGVRFTTSGSRCFQDGNTVLHYYEVEFSAREGHPDGWRTSIIERYDFVGEKIGQLAAYYADTTAFVNFFS